MDISWHTQLAEAWAQRAQLGRLPHAVLLSGIVGTGKRAAAVWMARRKLIGEDRELPEYPFDRPELADLHWIQPPEGKQAIGIEQIRALVADLSLTSYEGRGKVAVIEPANAMTINAANSLLKTLEEPPGDTLLILVADRLGNLPATIVSRCQRIELATPAENEGLAWLDRYHPGTAWSDALHAADLAPLRAIDTLEQLDTSRAIGREFIDVAKGRVSAIDVAARWAKIEPQFVLDWLSRQIRLAAVTLHAGRKHAPGLAIDDSVLKRIDTRNLFCYLDTINRLRSQSPGSFNVQLSLEGLLIDWAEGLEHARRDHNLDGLELMLAGR